MNYVIGLLHGLVLDKLSCYWEITVFEHEFGPLQCRDQLVRRQRLTQRDYKVNKGLADACRQDLKTHQCLRGSPTETRHGKLSSILLCLEGAERDGK